MSVDAQLASDHAHAWTTALTSDTTAAVDLYADDLVYDDHADADHVVDTAITKAELRPRLAPFANKDATNGVGLHNFIATEAFHLAGVGGNVVDLSTHLVGGPDAPVYVMTLRVTLPGPHAEAAAEAVMAAADGLGVHCVVHPDESDTL